VSAPYRYRSPYRTEAERLDALVADSELRAAGVIEDDQPTEFSHDAFMRVYEERAFGEFKPEERWAIRSALGLLAHMDGSA
jgi:hypothetical protein